MISIIVPIYNVEKYIEKCLESIVNQDYKDFELLLVNDGTIDNSVNVAVNYLKNKKVAYQIINKINGGLASARNAGIKKAKGEYIAFIDSDDCIASDFLSKLISQFVNDIDIAFCNFEYVKSQRTPNDDNQRIREFNRKELLNIFLKRQINFVVPSMMFKKEFIINNELYFNEDIKFSEDQPFIWNVILHSNKSIYLYKKMYGYYLRENSIMTSSSYDKIEKSYEEYNNYIKNLKNKYPEYSRIMNMIMPRWCLGTLYTSAKLLDYSDYKKLYVKFNGKDIFKNIIKIGDRNAYLLGAVCSVSCKLMYTLCTKMRLE